MGGTQIDSYFFNLYALFRLFVQATVCLYLTFLRQYTFVLWLIFFVSPS